MPTLRRVPKGARLTVAHCLTTVFKKLVEENCVAAWEELLLFPFAVLTVPEKSDEVKNLTTWVKKNVRLWEDDPSAAIPRPRHRKEGKSAPGAFQAKKVEAKLADGDVRGALRLLESEDTIAPYDETTRQQLLVKHPRHPEPAQFPQPLDPAPVIAPLRQQRCRRGSGASRQAVQGGWTRSALRS